MYPHKLTFTLGTRTRLPVPDIDDSTSANFCDVTSSPCDMDLNNSFELRLRLLLYRNYAQGFEAMRYNIRRRYRNLV